MKVTVHVIHYLALQDLGDEQALTLYTLTFPLVRCFAPELQVSLCKESVVTFDLKI